MRNLKEPFATSLPGKDLYVTVVKDATEVEARGSVVKVPNVE